MKPETLAELERWQPAFEVRAERGMYPALRVQFNDARDSEQTPIVASMHPDAFYFYRGAPGAVGEADAAAFLASLWNNAAELLAYIRELEAVAEAARAELRGGQWQREPKCQCDHEDDGTLCGYHEARFRDISRQSLTLMVIDLSDAMTFHRERIGSALATLDASQRSEP